MNSWRQEHSSFKFVNEIICFFANQVTSEIMNGIFFGEALIQYLFDHLVFEISFSIKVLCLNIAYALWFRTFEKNQICRKELVAIYSHDHSHFERPPVLLSKFSGYRVVHVNFFVVFQFVGLMPLVIFKDIFDHWHNNHESQRHQHDWLPSRNWNDRYHLHERYQ